MIKLFRYFELLFDSVRISRQRLKEFTEDHILKLTANNPGGIFTAILTDITSAYNNYYGDIASAEVNLAVQEGKTIAMNESRVALENNIRSNEGHIKYVYRDNLGFYQEFYPLGMLEYTRASIETLKTRGNRGILPQ